MYRFSVAESVNPNDYVRSGISAGQDAILAQQTIANNSPDYGKLSLRGTNEKAKNKVNKAAVELQKRRTERDLAATGMANKASSANRKLIQNEIDNQRFAGKLAAAAELYEKGFGEKRKRTEPYQPDYSITEDLIKKLYGPQLERNQQRRDEIHKELDTLEGNPMMNPSSQKTGEQSVYPVQGQDNSSVRKVDYVPFNGNNQNRYALTQMIRHAEGTLKQGDLGYRTMFGGGLFNSFDRHPDTVVHTNRNSSAAAGAYQFMPATWKDVQKMDPSITDFSPLNQEKAFDILARRRGIDPYADIKTDQDVIDVLNTLAPEWASLPMYSGASRYENQSVKSHQELIDVFRKAKESYLPPGVI